LPQEHRLNDRYAAPMAKIPAKALLTLLTMNRSRRERPDWDRIVTLSSIVVTVGLIALYAYGKATSRW
jgi:hypothetical protein